MTLRFDLPVWLVFPFLFTLGAVIGSFLNVCIYRIPTQLRLRDQLKSLSDRPSQCPRCRKNIRWFDNVPIFGWLLLRGRCRNCKMRISPRYPLIELLNACLWVLVFWLEVPYGLHASLSNSCLYTELGPQNIPGLGSLSPEMFVLLRFAFHMVLIEALLVATFIDFDLRIIPDATTIPATIFAVIASTVVARLHLVPVWFQSHNHAESFEIITPSWMHPFLGGPPVPAWISQHPHWHGLAVSLAGLAMGAGITWIVRKFGGMMLREEAMGDGDVILMGMIGAFLGWQAAVLTFFIAPVCAIAVVAFTYVAEFFSRWVLGIRSEMDRMIPYGPYLSLGALLTILFWRQLFERTQHVFELGVLLLPLAGIMISLFALCLVLVQTGKWVLGIRPEPELDQRWRPADQTWFFKGEHVDRHACRWKTQDWDGIAAAHGTIHQERWRQGGGGGDWGRRRSLPGR